MTRTIAVTIACGVLVSSIVLGGATGTKKKTTSRRADSTAAQASDTSTASAMDTSAATASRLAKAAASMSAAASSLAAAAATLADTSAAAKGESTTTVQGESTQTAAGDSGKAASGGAPKPAKQAVTVTAEQARAARKIMDTPPGGQPSCFTCHALGGKGGLPLEPALDQVGNHRSSVWILQWLRDPKAMKPNTLMPKYTFTEKQLNTLVPYLASLRKNIPSQQILSSAKSPADAGRELFKAWDCYACHAVGKVGHTNAPALTKVGAKYPAPVLTMWIKSPQKIKKGAFMPAFEEMSDAEVEAVVAYLGTLK
jgi:cytochrome c1